MAGVWNLFHLYRNFASITVRLRVCVAWKKWFVLTHIASITAGCELLLQMS